MESLLGQQNRYLCAPAFQSTPVCARLLPWCSCCVRVVWLGLSFTAGGATENSSKRVLIVLGLSCY